MLSLMLAFLILSGVLSESALRGIRVRRRLPRELFAEAEKPVLLEVTNSQWRVPSFAVLVEDRSGPLGGDAQSAGRCFFLRIGAGETETRTYRLRPERRGLLQFTQFRVSTRFPFGLFSKSLLIDAPEEALVYPALGPAATLPRRGSATGAEASSATALHGSVIAGLRSYVEGDPQRRIHWKSSLRRGVLLVGERENELEPEVEVRLSTAGATVSAEATAKAEQPPYDGFEHRVRRAASEVVHHLEAGLRVSLRTDALHVVAGSGPGHRAKLLT